MKRLLYLFLIAAAVIGGDACQTKEPVLAAPNGAVAVATVNPAKAYFDVTSLATAEFEFTLRGDDFGRNVPVASIEVWSGLNAPRITFATSMTACGNGVGCVYPAGSLGPLPVRLGTSDKLIRTVSTLPATVNLKATDLVGPAGVALTALRQNDTFQLKFVVITADGRRFDAFHDGICDETRGQVGDCRLVIRVDNKRALYQPLK